MRIFRTIAFLLTCIVIGLGVLALFSKPTKIEIYTSDPNDQIIQKSKLVSMEVTAYCPCKLCCGDWSDRHFADGSQVGGKAIAADTSYWPMGTKMDVPGYGTATVKDRGGAIKGRYRLDLYFDSHKDALEYGHQYNVNVTILKGS